MRQSRAHFRKAFDVFIGNPRTQAATSTMRPGEVIGGPQNKHRRSDQWLYVVAGSGLAIVRKHRYRLQPGTILLIERGDPHEIRNTGRKSLNALNFYVPPAYDSDGDPLPSGKS